MNKGKYKQLPGTSELQTIHTIWNAEALPQKKVTNPVGAK